MAVLLDTNALLLVGVVPVAPPASAVVSFADDGVRATGSWLALDWPNEPGDRRFIAVLRAEQVASLHAVPFRLFDGDGDGDGAARIAVSGIARLEIEANPLVAWLRDNGADLAAIFDFVRDALIPDGDAASPRIEQFVMALLTAISEHDGFVEIVARPECGGLLMQGWSVHLPADVLDLGLLAGRLHTHQAAVAHFHRSDLLSNARGFVGFARTVRDVGPLALQHVFFRVNGNYYRLDIVENRLLLDGTQVAGHLADMAKRLQGPPQAQRGVKRICRPRYPGHDTVSTLDKPVRVACDAVLHARGAGFFVSGWLLDPKRIVSCVVLKSTGGFYARIEQLMVRLPRPDVSDGYAADPLFAGSLQPWDTLHGFMAFVPRSDPLSADEQHYLELVLEDESCAFLPLRFHDGDQEAQLKQILGTVNIDDPEFERLVVDHLSPLVAAVAATTARPAKPVSSMPFGPRASELPKVSIVLPLTDGWSDFDVNLAHFARDADFGDAELIVVAARAAADRIATRLRQCAAFYGLRGRLVLSGLQPDFHEALSLGASVSSADRLLLLAATVFPRRSGWLGRLLAEHAHLPADAALSPTLIYEDHSIRFAGRSNPPPRGRHRDPGCLTGYGEQCLTTTETTAVWAGSVECCLLSRALFLRSGGFATEYLCPQLKSLDFVMRVKEKGGCFYWMPSESLWALDAGNRQDGGYWLRVRQLVDDRTFERTWGEALAGTAGSAETRR